MQRQPTRRGNEAEDAAAWQQALNRFGVLVDEETSRLLSMAKQTLTFTVTYRAVSSLVVQDGHGTALLGVAVFILLFIIVALNSYVTDQLKRTPCNTQAPVVPKAVNMRIVRFLALCNEVAVQFISNLIAVVLSTTFAEAESVWWIMAFSAIGMALIGHATAPTV